MITINEVSSNSGAVQLSVVALGQHSRHRRPPPTRAGR